MWSKSSELLENLKTSADSAFLFWPIEAKRKHETGGISKKCQFKPREINRPSACVNTSILKSFNFQKFAKIWERRVFSSVEDGKYKNLGNCLVLAEKHLSGIHCKFLK